MADTSCPGIISNPDLVGIGTRINLYVTILLVAAVPQHEYTTELLDELYTNAVFYTLALLITVVVQTIKGQLDLYHAIFVMHVVACLSVFKHYGFNRMISARRTNFTLKMTILAQYINGSIIMPPWALYVWIKDSRFGAQPECNHLVKYVVFFVSVRATAKWLRILCLIVASFALFWAWTSVSLKSIPSILSGLFAGSDEESDDESDIEVHCPNFLTWFTSVMLAVYSLVSAELIVHRNRPYVQGGEGSWGFGQVISVLLLLPIFVEFLAILGKCLEPTPEERAIARERVKERAKGQVKEKAEGQEEGTAEGQAEGQAEGTVEEGAVEEAEGKTERQAGEQAVECIDVTTVV